MHSQRLAANRRSKLEELENKWRSATDKATVFKCKDEIKRLLLYNVKSVQIRAKVEELENRDLPTKYLLRREQERADGKNLNKILDNGVQLTEPKDILESVYRYYSTLYSLQCIDDELIDAESNDIPRLNDIDRSMCEGPLTYEECWRAVKGMKNEKSPGSDGLPAKFYQAFFPLFGDTFVNIIPSLKRFQFSRLPCVLVI
jgi:hypothetical protein